MPRIPNQKKEYDKLNGRLSKYVAFVQQLYKTMNDEAARLALSTDYDGSVPFSWSDYPETKDGIRKLQQKFVNELATVVMAGTMDEWKRSNTFQNLVADKVLKAYHVERKKGTYTQYYRDNSDVLKAFQSRRDHGMNLSDKLWEQSKEYKAELEDAIGAAIERGTDAITLSKQISKYLRDFPSLKDDYKEKFGTAVQSGDCEYRSIRLARSEINMAYRKAEQTRWQQFDFVVGYEIKLSGSHPKEDVCDRLAGKYPKDFVWTGWHPNDLCYCVPILKTEEEFFATDSTQEKEVIDYANSEKVDAFLKKKEYGFMFETKDVFATNFRQEDRGAVELFADRLGRFNPLGDTIQFDKQDIISTQQYVGTENVRQLAKSIEENGMNDAPTGIRVGDKVFIVDGHNRLAAEMISGSNKLSIRCVDVSEVEWLKAGGTKPNGGFESSAIKKDVKSINEVTDVPDGFKEWMLENYRRMEDAEGVGTLPYFVRDNMSFIRGVSGEYELPLDVDYAYAIQVKDFSQKQIDTAIKESLPSSSKLTSTDYPIEYIRDIRAAAKLCKIDTEELDRVLESYRKSGMLYSGNTTRYDVDHEISRLFYRKHRERKDGTVYCPVLDTFKKIHGELSDEQYQVYRFHVLAIDHEHRMSFAQRAIDAIMRTPGYAGLYNDAEFRELRKGTENMTIEAFWNKYQSCVTRLYEKSKEKNVREGFENEDSELRALLYGKGKVSTVVGSHWDYEKADLGIIKLANHEKEYACNVLNTMPFTNYAAETKMRALMPRSIEFVNFKSGYDIHKNINEEIFALYEGLSACPSVVEKINFIGTEVGQYDTVIKSMVDYYFNETSVFKNSYPDEQQRRLAIYDILTEGKHDGRTVYWYIEQRRKDGDDDNFKAFYKMSSLQAKSYSRWENGKKRRCTLKQRYLNEYAVAFSDPITFPVDIDKKYKKYVNGIVFVSTGNGDEKLAEIIKHNAGSFHPKGTERVRSIFDHEFGHKIDEFLEYISSDRDFMDIAVKNEDISAYPFSYDIAAQRRIELLAEAYSEYMCSSDPREYALSVGRLISEKLGVDPRKVRDEIEKFIENQKIKEKWRKK